jgi:hypothetical protein
MSARLNMNEIRYFPWKGKTFNQITSIIKKNSIPSNNSSHSYFMPPPLKIYRREIVSSTDASYNCKTNKSMSIDMFDMPGGTIVNSSSATTNGLINTLDINLTNNKYERPGSCQTDVSYCLSQVSNARRRVRSSGIIKKQFDLTKNNDTTYHTSTNQYLVSRNRTFQQNQYYYIRQGNSAAKPGDPLSKENIYSPNGINHCKNYLITTDTSFSYQWVDRNFYQVDISSGNYTVDDVNGVFQRVMTNNKHYFINNQTGSYIYLLNISYNNASNKIELKSFQTSLDIFNSSQYSLPLDEYNNVITTWQNDLFLYQDSNNIPATNVHISVWPVFIISNNIFQQAIGINQGQYPNNLIQIVTDQSQPNHGANIDQGYSSDLIFSSTFIPGLQPSYVQIYYKPNNPQFAQQGAVSASSHTARERYNTITNNTALYRNAYGLSVANALAYGVPENGYTQKDKMGYPNKQTPVFSMYSDNVTCKTKTIPHVL